MSKPKPTCLTSASSNTYLEDASSAIIVPDRRIAEEYLHRDLKLNRIEEAQTPNERIKLLLRSMFDYRVQSTHESEWIWTMTVVGFFGSAFLGGIINSRDIQEQYIRKNNASVFEGKFVGNRHFWDTLVSGCSARGFRYGLRGSILMFASTFMAFGSTVYRNKIYLPDFMIGFATVGAISRLWVGPRAMAGGAVIGALTGVGACGVLKLMEVANNKTAAEMRHLEHIDYMAKRKTRHLEMQLVQEEATKEYMEENYGS